MASHLIIQFLENLEKLFLSLKMIIKKDFFNFIQPLMCNTSERYFINHLNVIPTCANSFKNRNLRKKKLINNVYK